MKTWELEEKQNKIFEKKAAPTHAREAWETAFPGDRAFCRQGRAGPGRAPSLEPGHNQGLSMPLPSEAGTQVGSMAPAWTSVHLVPSPVRREPKTQTPLTRGCLHRYPQPLGPWNIPEKPTSPGLQSPGGEAARSTPQG